MKFGTYLLGIILGLTIGFGLTWSYFNHFQSYAGFAIVALIPATIFGLCFYGSDAQWRL